MLHVRRTQCTTFMNLMRPEIRRVARKCAVRCVSAHFTSPGPDSNAHDTPKDHTHTHTQGQRGQRHSRTFSHVHTQFHESGKRCALPTVCWKIRCSTESEMLRTRTCCRFSLADKSESPMPKARRCAPSGGAFAGALDCVTQTGFCSLRVAHFAARKTCNDRCATPEVLQSSVGVFAWNPIACAHVTNVCRYDDAGNLGATAGFCFVFKNYRIVAEIWRIIESGHCVVGNDGGVIEIDQRVQVGFICDTT